MEREFTRCLTPRNEEKLERLIDATFNFLWTGFHTLNDFHFDFARNTLSDAVYKFAPRLLSGWISEAAKQAVLERKVVRTQLCKEHPKTRNSTAIELINTFDHHSLVGSSNSVIRADIGRILHDGSQVNLVLSQENVRLMPFQKMGLSASECYKLADINLVPDEREPEREYVYQGKIYNTQPEIARDLNISITTVQRRIKRGEITVERKAA